MSGRRRYRVGFGRLSPWLALSLAVSALPGAAAAQRVPPDPRTGSGPRLSDAPEAHIRDLRVIPGTVNARFEFRARSRLSAVVQLSPNTPVRDAQGRWEFRTAVPTRRIAERGGTGEYAIVVGSLAPGRRYHYVVTLQGSDPRRPHQLTGELTTDRLVADAASEAKLTESAGYHIRTVRVEPTATTVAISFQGRPEQVPIVEIGRRAPRPNLDGRLEFREALVGGYPMGGSPANGIYRIEIGDRVALEQGAEYHYLITVPSGSVRRPYQQAGTFRMQEQSVRVVFTSIELRNDGNRGNGTALRFAVSVNDVALPLENGGVHRLWAGGEVHMAQELVVPKAADTLMVRVVATGIPELGGALGAARAQQMYDLARRPGTKPRVISFLLDSEPASGGSRLSFRVLGYVEITRR